MPVRIKAVIKSKGGPTKYQTFFIINKKRIFKLYPVFSLVADAEYLHKLYH